jgi:hypothetical protein
MNNKAQGTIEYLIIIAIVVVISLVVTSILTGFLTTGSTITPTSQDIKQQTQVLALTDIITNPDGNYLLEIQSNQTGNITINQITTDTNQQIYYSNNTLTLGSTKYFQIYSNDTCEEGTTTVQKNIIVTYTSEYGLIKTQHYYDVIIPCQTYGLNDGASLANTQETIVEENIIEEIFFECNSGDTNTCAPCDIGTCETGEKVCVNGFWSACVGTPTTKVGNIDLGMYQSSSESSHNLAYLGSNGYKYITGRGLSSTASVILSGDYSENLGPLINKSFIFILDVYGTIKKTIIAETTGNAIFLFNNDLNNNLIATSSINSNTTIDGNLISYTHSGTSGLIIFKIEEETVKWILNSSGGESITQNQRNIDSLGNIFSLGVFKGNVQIGDTQIQHSIGTTNDGYISKISPDGVVEWVKTIWTESTTFTPGTISFDDEGSAYFSIKHNSDLNFDGLIIPATSEKLTLLKIDTDGTVVGFISITGDGSTKIMNISTSGENTMIYGRLSGPNVYIGNDSYLTTTNVSYVASLNSDLNLNWSKLITNSTSIPVIANHQNGNLYFNTSFNTSSPIDFNGINISEYGGKGTFLAKISSTGEILDTNIYSIDYGSALNVSTSLSELNNQDIIFTVNYSPGIKLNGTELNNQGYASNNIKYIGETNSWDKNLISNTNNLSIMWIYEYGNSLYGSMQYSGNFNIDNNYFTTTKISNSGVFKFNKSGELQWSKTMSSNGTNLSSTSTNVNINNFEKGTITFMERSGNDANIEGTVYTNPSTQTYYLASIDENGNLGPIQKASNQYSFMVYNRLVDEFGNFLITLWPNSDVPIIYNGVTYPIMPTRFHGLILINPTS